MTVNTKFIAFLIAAFTAITVHAAPNALIGAAKRSVEAYGNHFTGYSSHEEGAEIAARQTHPYCTPYSACQGSNCCPHPFKEDPAQEEVQRAIAAASKLAVREEQESDGTWCDEHPNDCLPAHLAVDRRSAAEGQNEKVRRWNPKEEVDDTHQRLRRQSEPRSVAHASGYFANLDDLAREIQNEELKRIRRA